MRYANHLNFFAVVCELVFKVVYAIDFIFYYYCFDHGLEHLFNYKSTSNGMK